MTQMFDDIMANMDKELGQQRMKVNHLGQQRQVIGRRLENLEQNLAENKVVWMELCKLKIHDLYISLSIIFLLLFLGLVPKMADLRH